MTTDTRQPDLMTVTEAAQTLGQTRGAIHYQRLYGRLPAVAINGRFMIPRKSVEALRVERDAKLK
jgi:hypothetical protein